MFTHFTADLAEERRDRWIAEARVAHAARLAGQDGRSHRTAKSRVPARWFFGRRTRYAADGLVAEPRPVAEGNPQGLPRRTGDTTNRIASAPAGQDVVRADLVPTGQPR